MQITATPNILENNFGFLTARCVPSRLTKRSTLVELKLAFPQTEGIYYATKQLKYIVLHRDRAEK